MLSLMFSSAYCTPLLCVKSCQHLALYYVHLSRWHLGSYALLCHCVMMFVLYYSTLCYVCQEYFHASVLMCSPVLRLCPGDISWSAPAIALLQLMGDIACHMLCLSVSSTSCQLYFACMLSCFHASILVYCASTQVASRGLLLRLASPSNSPSNPLNAAFLKLQSTPLSFHHQNLIWRNKKEASRHTHWCSLFFVNSKSSPMWHTPNTAVDIIKSVRRWMTMKVPWYTRLWLNCDAFDDCDDECLEFAWWEEGLRCISWATSPDWQTGWMYFYDDEDALL